MTHATLHSHGTSRKQQHTLPEPYVCPKCQTRFETLFQFGKHVRESHEERTGL